MYVALAVTRLISNMLNRSIYCNAGLAAVGHTIKMLGTIVKQ